MSGRYYGTVRRARDYGSVRRGVKAMPRKLDLLRMWSARRSLGFWAHWWTPTWHDGRGPYVSIGLGFFAVYRGY